MTNLDRIDYISRGLQEFAGEKMVLLTLTKDEHEALQLELEEEYCICDGAYTLEVIDSKFDVNDEPEPYSSLKIFGITFNFTIV